LAALGLSICAAYNLLWSSLYSADTLAERAGIDTKPVSAQELYDTALYFTETVNAYAPLVSRDENGVFDASVQEIFAAAPGLYKNAEALIPVLAGAERRPKQIVFSKFMSYINFTGFFFPFTGEANLNTDAPLCFLPSTVAHEMAHQRGVAAEDEANFAAVVAGMSSENDVYIYSSALMAFTYLGNALYDADPQLWYEISDMLSAPVRADLDDNYAYWRQYETKAAELSEAVYNEFLQSNGQELGVKSYGACVDLLVAWYGSATT